MSKYGWRVHPILGVRKLHEGIDIWAPEGTPIKAAAGGVVVWAGPRGGYGNAVIIDHGSGVGTVYAHQSSVAVGAGQSVSRGQVIGYVGHTGLAGGPHLHFEVRVGVGRTTRWPTCTPAELTWAGVDALRVPCLRMDYTQIAYDVSERIATVTLDRPDQLNAFTGRMMHELLDALDRSDSDDGVGRS